MIIVKAPLRISLGGGGTDLPSYYSQFGSSFISAAINQHVYISAHRTFARDIIVKYSETEKVSAPAQVRHPLVREALLKAGVTDSIEVVSFADIPAGTGLGSSGTFTVAVLKALYAFTNRFHDPISLADDACDIEMNKLGSPVGKQDQFIASVGGISKFVIDKQGKVTASPLMMPNAARIDLEEHLLLFFTGFARDANTILGEQDTASKAQSSSMLENLHFTQKLGHEIEAALIKGDLNEFARLMNVHWEHKKKRSNNMSNGKIDTWYDLALNNGALGGKLIGAGGGGFLMFLAEDKRRLRKAMAEAGMVDVPFRFDSLGAQVVLHEE